MENSFQVKKPPLKCQVAIFPSFLVSTLFYQRTKDFAVLWNIDSYTDILWSVIWTFSPSGRANSSSHITGMPFTFACIYFFFSFSREIEDMAPVDYFPHFCRTSWQWLSKKWLFYYKLPNLIKGIIPCIDSTLMLIWHQALSFILIDRSDVFCLGHLL